MVPFPLALLPGPPSRGEDVPLPAVALRRLAAFLDDLSVRGYSQRTLFHYGNDLRLFLIYLVHVAGVSDPATATRQHLAAWQSALCAYRDEWSKDNHGYGLSTQGKKCAEVKSFYSYLLRSRALLLDPAAHLPSPKREKRLPQGVLTVEETKALLETSDTGTARGLRNRAMLETLYSTGLRRDELLALRLYDVELSEGWVRVEQGKGKKDRVVPLGQQAALWLTRYLSEARPKLARDGSGDALFLSSRGGRRLGRQGLRAILLARAKESGFTRRITPHLLRHTLATHLLQGGADIRYIQAILGHANLAATQIYTRVDIGHLKKVHQRCHPRG